MVIINFIRKYLNSYKIVVIIMITLTVAFFTSIKKGEISRNELLAEQAPAIIKINKVKGPKGTVDFNHDQHSKSKGLVCKTCHHIGSQYSCNGVGCHNEKREGKTRPLLSAYHDQCIGCHKKSNINSKCETCHR